MHSSIYRYRGATGEPSDRKASLLTSINPLPVAVLPAVSDYKLGRRVRAPIETVPRVFRLFCQISQGDVQLRARHNEQLPLGLRPERRFASEALNASAMVCLRDLAHICPAPLERAGPAAICTKDTLQRSRLHILLRSYSACKGRTNFLAKLPAAAS